MILRTMKEPVAQIIDSLSVGDPRFETVHGDPGCSTPWHDHPVTYIDLYLEGVAKASWHSDVHAFTASVLPAGVMHRSLALTPVRTMQVIIPEAWISDSGSCQLGPNTFDSSRPVHIAGKMAHALSRRDELSPIDLESLLLDFWAAATNSVLPPLERKGCHWLIRVEEYLEAHYSETICSQAIGRAVGVHPAHMMRQFRRAHRCTIGDYVRSLRIERACQMMRSSSLTLSEIAHEIGFADQSHFNRSFRSQMGVTPSAYGLAVGSSSFAGAS